MAKKKKSKKLAVPREVKRPPYKKPRPKKYIEAKIPKLPPVDKEPAEAKAPPNSITIDLPEDFTSSEAFVKAAVEATDTLYYTALRGLQNEQEARAKELAKEQANYRALCGTRFYKDPSVGLIHRHNYENEITGRRKWSKSPEGKYVSEDIVDSTYVKMLKEEKEASQKKNDEVYEAQRKQYADRINKEKSKWYNRLFSWFNK